jgi:hypothetical protein
MFERFCGGSGVGSSPIDLGSGSAVFSSLLEFGIGDISLRYTEESG